MTPDEEDRIAREQEEKLKGWRLLTLALRFRDLSEEEALVWVEAEIENTANAGDDLEQQSADYESLLNLAAIHGTNPIAAIKAVQFNPTRTQFEMDALAAWEVSVLNFQSSSLAGLTDLAHRNGSDRPATGARLARKAERSPGTFFLEIFDKPTIQSQRLANEGLTFTYYVTPLTWRDG